jgi:hypothetical protein
MDYNKKKGRKDLYFFVDYNKKKGRKDLKETLVSFIIEWKPPTFCELFMTTITIKIDTIGLCYH